MKKIRLREVLLLLIPLFLFTPVLWRWKTGSITPSHNLVPIKQGFDIKLKNVRKESPNARDVYEGFDKRVVIELELPEFDYPPGWQYDHISFTSIGNMKLISKENSRIRNLHMQKPERARYIWGYRDKAIAYSMRLYDLNHVKGPIFLEGVLVSGAWFKTPQGNRPVFAKPYPVSIKIRDANEKSRLPAVSRWHPFRFIKSDVEKVSHRDAFDYEDTKINVYVEKIVAKSRVSHSDFSFETEWVDPRLENEKGERLKLIDGPGAGMQKYKPEIDKPYDTTTEKGMYVFPVTCTMWRIRPRTGKVIFKGALSYDNGWPLPVEIVVRNK